MRVRGTDRDWTLQAGQEKMSANENYFRQKPLQTRPNKHFSSVDLSNLARWCLCRWKKMFPTPDTPEENRNWNRRINISWLMLFFLLPASNSSLTNPMYCFWRMFMPLCAECEELCRQTYVLSILHRHAVNPHKRSTVSVTDGALCGKLQAIFHHLVSGFYWDKTRMTFGRSSAVF